MCGPGGVGLVAFFKTHYYYIVEELLMKYKEKWIRELGEEKGLEKWNAWRETISKRNSGSRKEKWIKEFGEEKGMEKWEAFLKHNSEIGTLNNPMKGRTVYSIWLEKYGKEEADRRQAEWKRKLSVAFSGEKNNMYGRNGNPWFQGTVYDIWLEKYGKEEADKRHAEWKRKISVASTGKGNGMYGRSPGHAAGLGYAGKYKGWYFRSLLELSYMIGVIEKQNLIWERGEQKKFRVYYVDSKGTERSYCPDFFLVDERKIVEIKPAYILKYPAAKQKITRSKEHYEKFGYTYEVVTPKILPIKDIYELYNKQEITVGERNKLKFESFFEKWKKNEIKEA